MTAPLPAPIRACSSLGCPEKSLPDFFALAQRHGLMAVELRALAGRIDLPAYFTETYGTPATFARELAALPPIRVPVIGTSFRLADHQPADREELLATVPWALAAGVRWLRVFDGGQTCDPAFPSAAAASLRWWREVRQRHGWALDLAVETHDSLLTGAAIRRLIAAAPETRILWDSHHTWRRGGEDPVQTFQAIHASVVHLHVKDSVSTPSAPQPYAYTLPGAGEFPLGPLLHLLQEARFEGCVSLEWEKLWHPELPPLDAALEAARTWW